MGLKSKGEELQMQINTGCLGPERGISKFQSCSYTCSRDRDYTVGFIKASELFEHVVRGPNRRGRSYRCKLTLCWGSLGPER